MKVYFINLDRSSDRLDWFRRQGGRLGLDMVRVPAVDGREMDEAELSRLRGLSSGNSLLSTSEVACFLSHRKIWRSVADGDEDWAFVAEDDIHFSSDAGAFLNSTGWIPANSYLIKAETNLKRQELSRAVLGRPSGHELRELRSNHFCSGGYFLSRDGAARLLAFSDVRCEPVDVILFSPDIGVMREMSVLQLSPAICLQDMFVPGHEGKTLESVIDTARTDRRKSEKQALRREKKLRREAKRVAGQIVEPFRRLFLIATGHSVFRTVPFEIGSGARSNAQ